MSGGVVVLKTFIMLEVSRRTHSFTKMIQGRFHDEFLPHVWIFKFTFGRWGAGLIADDHWHDILSDWVRDCPELDQRCIVVQEEYVGCVEDMLLARGQGVTLVSKQAVHIVYDQQCQ